MLRSSQRSTEIWTGNFEAQELQVMAAAIAGCPNAFDEIQKMYSSRLSRTIFRITRNREDAEDALQDTFLKAYMSFHRFEGRSSVYSWLTRIAINSALMILRKRRNHPEFVLLSSFEDSDGHLLFEPEETANNPEQQCELRQRWKHIVQAIERLEPQLRKALEIQITEELPSKEVAKSLNISAAAAKSRLYRARTRLATRIHLQRSHTPRIKGPK